MTPYLWRLCCLSLAVVFVVQLIVGLVWRGLAPVIVRFAEGIDPAKAASLMLWLRWLPAACGAFVSLCLCAPAYLRLEPLVGDEEIGYSGMFLTGLALLSYLIPAGRVAWGAWRSEVRLRALVRDAEERSGVYVIRETSPAMALAGLFHARVVVSREVVELLPPDQMEAAQRHERAHRESWDNWKRLVLEAAPLDSSGLELRRAWARFAEWAADDKATAGNTARSVALASALVSVARLGSFEECLTQASMLVSDGRDLRVRVERLLEPSGQVPLRPRVWPVACFLGAAAAMLVAFAQKPECAAMVHRVLETLVD